MSWNIGEAIKELREDLGYSQKDIAIKLGIAPRTLSNYENNERKIPIDLVGSLAEILGVTVDYLVSGTKNVITPKGNMKVKFKSGNYSVIKNEQIQELIKMLEENKIDAEAFIKELIIKADSK